MQSCSLATNCSSCLLSNEQLEILFLKASSAAHQPAVSWVMSSFRSCFFTSSNAVPWTPTLLSVFWAMSSFILQLSFICLLGRHWLCFFSNSCHSCQCLCFLSNSCHSCQFLCFFSNSSCPSCHCLCFFSNSCHSCHCLCFFSNSCHRCFKYKQTAAASFWKPSQMIHLAAVPAQLSLVQLSCISFLWFSNNVLAAAAAYSWQLSKLYFYLLFYCFSLQNCFFPLLFSP